MVIRTIGSAKVAVGMSQYATNLVLPYVSHNSHYRNEYQYVDYDPISKVSISSIIRVYSLY